MEERKIVKLKKDEYEVREYIKRNLGKGRISKIKIDYTPVGEKVVIFTSKPGMIIGRGGEKIEELTQTLKKKFTLENPYVEISQVTEPEFDAQIMSDEIALAIENLGPLKFKVIAYKTLQKIMDKGALGAEIRLSGKLPGARAKSWRFSQGYLKKTGDSAKVVERAKSVAQTKPGTIGVKVSILSPNAFLKDKILIDDELIKKIKIKQEDVENKENAKPTKLKKPKENNNG
ncbi:30S ribosomal protein S3 [Candidatus Pacearchaeota archaeon]|nr:30S ribosomal protein S3 [Candidatus Pacearchaeota archaeon]